MSTYLNVSTQVVPIRMEGCGHLVYLTRSHNQLLLDKRPKKWFCTICGHENYYSGKSEADKLRAQLTSVKDQRDTARKQRDRAEHRRRGEKAAKTRLKNRVAAGVCPCCNRTFKQLARHMKSQHPGYVMEKDSG